MASMDNLDVATFEAEVPNVEHVGQVVSVNVSFDEHLDLLVITILSVTSCIGEKVVGEVVSEIVVSPRSS